MMIDAGPQPQLGPALHSLACNARRSSPTAAAVHLLAAGGLQGDLVGLHHELGVGASLQEKKRHRERVYGGNAVAEDGCEARRQRGAGAAGAGWRVAAAASIPRALRPAAP